MASGHRILWPRRGFRLGLLRVNEKKDRELKALHEGIVVLAEAQTAAVFKVEPALVAQGDASTNCADGHRESRASHARVQAPLRLSPPHCREFPRTSRVLWQGRFRGARGIENHMEFFRRALGHYLTWLGAEDAAAMFVTGTDVAG